ncbi:MAG: Mannosylglucosyl-3-phosphoglycerate phosphatase [Olavius algarvensis Delta 4 endosymbiont]|nr:MAG: Mannosylglucosyl-3-phosphoglycerate phosphatase [Olavius algarvensis Delta 4 endosymbiont]
MIPDHLTAWFQPLEPIATKLSPRLPSRLQIDAILFDVYGTLFISGSGDISLTRSIGSPAENLSALLEKYGIAIGGDALREQLFAAIEKAHGHSRDKGIAYPEVQIDSIWQVITGIQDYQTIRDFAIEYELLVNPVGPMPHLAELLAACRRAHLAMGIISNAQFFTPLLFDWFLDNSPENLGFSEDLLFYSWRWGCAKPSEILFQAAARRLADRGIDRQRVLFIGNDMRNDMLPARDTGFRTALFAGDQRSLRLRRDDQRCADLAPDLIVTDLIQLAELIDIL